MARVERRVVANLPKMQRRDSPIAIGLTAVPLVSLHCGTILAAQVKDAAVLGRFWGDNLNIFYKNLALRCCVSLRISRFPKIRFYDFSKIRFYTFRDLFQLFLGSYFNTPRSGAHPLFIRLVVGLDKFVC